jgi:hypothetical protein
MDYSSNVGEWGFCEVPPVERVFIATRLKQLLHIDLFSGQYMPR